MATRRPSRVGSMSWSDFDMGLRRVLRRVTTGICADLAAARTMVGLGMNGDTDVSKMVNHAWSRFVERSGRWLPEGIGWLGGGGPRKASTFARPIVVTFQPIDGRSRLSDVLAASRLPEPGEISVTLGVLVDGEPVGGYVCDVRTRTVYVRQPYGVRILRTTEKGVVADLAEIQGKPAFLSGGPALHYGPGEVSSPLVRRLLGQTFGGVVRSDDSLVLSVMRVLTGDFVAVVRPAGGTTTPFGDAPIAAICNQGDLIALRVSGGRLIQINPMSLVKTQRRPFDVMYVGRRHLAELRRHATVIML